MRLYLCRDSHQALERLKLVKIRSGQFIESNKQGRQWTGCNPTCPCRPQPNPPSGCPPTPPHQQSLRVGSSMGSLRFPGF